jgi:DNA-binding beta-propeller fold protein YncE
VTSGGTNSVLRYDGQTGAYLEIFISSGSGGLSMPTGLAFGPDGHVYVASFGSSKILRYDGHTGAFLDVFVPTGTGGLARPQTPVFGPDGYLYVAGNGRILRFHATTGKLIDIFVDPESGGLQGVEGMAFGPDGHLYVSSNSRGQGSIRRYDGSTGRFLDSLTRQTVSPKTARLWYLAPLNCYTCATSVTATCRGMTSLKERLGTNSYRGRVSLTRFC